MRERTIASSRTALRWLVAGVMVFRLLLMALVAFESELAAIASPPPLFFTSTLENFANMQQRVDYLARACDSIAIAFGSTILLTAPAASSVAFSRARSVVLWTLPGGLDMTAGGLDGRGCKDQAARD
jgi:sorbitol/mannitol transport system permease protein